MFQYPSQSPRSWRSQPMRASVFLTKFLVLWDCDWTRGDFGVAQEAGLEALGDSTPPWNMTRTEDMENYDLRHFLRPCV